MADTTYTTLVTKITADTMNDLNRLHYTIFSDPADLAAVKATLHAAPGAIGGTTPAAGAFTTITATGITTITGSNDITSIGGNAHFIIKAGDTNNDYAMQSFMTSAGGSIAVFGAKATTTGAAGVSVGQLDIAVQNAGSTTIVATLTPGAMAVTGTLSATGATTALSGTAIPAGGTAGSGVMVSSTANFGVFFGSGAPTLSAAKGSLYLRSDGSTTNDRMYVNTNGTTTWTAVTTVA